MKRQPYKSFKEANQSYVSDVSNTKTVDRSFEAFYERTKMTYKYILNSVFV